MLERVRRLFQGDSADTYIRKVATSLVRQGVTPNDLDEIQSQRTFERTSRIFTMLREQKLSPEEAAQAIKLAVNLFIKTRHMAETRGWPLKSEELASAVPRKEAYFLELLAEAASSVQFKA